VADVERGPPEEPSTMPTAPYFPAADAHWEHRPSSELGFDADILAEAVSYAIANESAVDRNLQGALDALTEGEGKFATIVGPTKPRGGPAGLILRHGYIATEWGDPLRVDMTFSASKSYLATLAGLAIDTGLIRDLDDPVREYVDDGGFDPPHNSKITWRHLLNQTSEWTGTLWGKPDQVDHNRGVGADRANFVAKGTRRELREPGAYWEYNDVRVNRLALALLHVWQRPLPVVFKDAVMDPIDASPTWQWHGYRNSYVQFGDRHIQSVSGGGHWGGGVWVSSRDHARFGYLHLRRGRWNDRQILSERWIEEATTPADINPGYGCLWWLNRGAARYPSAPASSYFALGWGSNIIWVDPDHDLVAVVRWIEPVAADGFMARVMAAVRA
jgi:CubicO group peptidase (beta-lactamase class C family)